MGGFKSRGTGLHPAWIRGVPTGSKRRQFEVLHLARNTVEGSGIFGQNYGLLGVRALQVCGPSPVAQEELLQHRSRTNSYEPEDTRTTGIVYNYTLNPPKSMNPEALNPLKPLNFEPQTLSAPDPLNLDPRSSSAGTIWQRHTVKATVSHATLPRQSSWGPSRQT